MTTIYDESIRQLTPPPRPRWLRLFDRLLDTALALMALAVFALAAARWGLLPVYLLASPVTIVGLALLCAHQRLRLAEAVQASAAAQMAASRAAEEARQAAEEAKQASAVVRAQRGIKQ